MDSISETIKEVTVEKIRKDPLAAEFKMAMFSAALLSYRRHSCLLPFPQAFVDDNGAKNIQQLEDVFGQLKSLQEFIRNASKFSPKAVSLLNWIVSEKSFSIRSCKEKSFQDLEIKTGKASFTVQPDYMFEVEYLNTNNSRKFDEHAENYGIKLGYHGSRLDNFHSILHSGLQVHMTKNALFGEGIYLSEDLAITLPYSQGGSVWKHSKLGQQLSCIAVCEIIDHPLVKCKVENSKPSRARAEGTQAGDVPEKYFVVTSSELVRLKYVLVFSKRSVNLRAKGRDWIFMKYPVATILLLYLLFLILMGIWKSNQMQMLFRRYWVKGFFSDTER